MHHQILKSSFNSLAPPPGRYYLQGEEPFAQGGQGTIWEATNQTGDPFAIKFFWPPAGLDEAVSERMLDSFHQEANVLYALNGHPKIVEIVMHGVHKVVSRAHDFERIERLPFIVMPRAEGSLHGLLAESSPDNSIPSRQTADCLAHIADALSAAHRLGILHRDIKPANIMFETTTDNAQTWLLGDFGIYTKSHVHPETVTANQGYAGTPAWSDPWQLRSQPVQSSDQYSLGLVGYSCLTGEKPVRLAPGQQSNLLTWLLAHQQKQLKPIERTTEDGTVDFIAEALGMVILKATALEINKRYSDMEEFREAVLQAKASGGAKQRKGIRFFGIPKIGQGSPRTTDAALGIDPAPTHSVIRRRKFLIKTLMWLVGSGAAVAGGLASIPNEENLDSFEAFAAEFNRIFEEPPENGSASELEHASVLKSVRAAAESFMDKQAFSAVGKLVEALAPYNKQNAQGLLSWLYQHRKMSKAVSPLVTAASAMAPYNTSIARQLANEWTLPLDTTQTFFLTPAIILANTSPRVAQALLKQPLPDRYHDMLRAALDPTNIKATERVFKANIKGLLTDEELLILARSMAPHGQALKKVVTDNRTTLAASPYLCNEIAIAFLPHDPLFSELMLSWIDNVHNKIGASVQFSAYHPAVAEALLQELLSEGMGSHGTLAQLATSLISYKPAIAEALRAQILPNDTNLTFALDPTNETLQTDMPRMLRGELKFDSYGEDNDKLDFVLALISAYQGSTR